MSLAFGVSHDPVRLAVRVSGVGASKGGVG